jgi:hypothetical protein
MLHRTGNLTPALMLLLLPLLLACASGTKIHTDYDDTVNFGNYRTFNFFSPMGIENPNYSTIFGAIFRETISREMVARGFRQSDDPDLLINVSARLEDKTRVTSQSNPFPPYYDYRADFYDPWYDYSYGTTTHVSQYTEGTINVDVVDARAKKMVFEGVAIGRVNEKETNEELRQAISDGVATIFQGFPRGAGGQSQ